VGGGGAEVVVKVRVDFGSVYVHAVFFGVQNNCLRFFYITKKKTSMFNIIF
jgi:hypothetical protein